MGQFSTYTTQVRGGPREKTIKGMAITRGSPKEAEKIALATDMNKWDDERTENGDPLSVDDVEEVTE